MYCLDFVILRAVEISCLVVYNLDARSLHVHSGKMSFFYFVIQWLSINMTIKIAYAWVFKLSFFDNVFNQYTTYSL